MRAYFAWLRESPLHWGPFVTSVLGLVLSIVALTLAVMVTM